MAARDPRGAEVKTLVLTCVIVGAFIEHFFGSEVLMYSVLATGILCPNAPPKWWPGLPKTTE